MATVVPLVPVLGLKDLSRLLRRPRPPVALAGGDGSRLLVFPRGAWALAAMVGELRRRRARARVVLYVPDYFCNESLAAVRREAAELVFYPITGTLDPDWDATNDLARRRRPDAFLLVHYFGVPRATAPAAEFCARFGAALVEDAAHLLMPRGEVGVRAWATLYSPHKILPVPQMGLLVIRGDDTELWGPTRVSDGRPVHETLRWACKRVGQAALVALGIRWRPASANGDETTDPARLRWNGVPRIALWLGSLQGELDEIARIRRRNYRRLDALLHGGGDAGSAPVFADLSAEAIPYLFAALVDDGRSMAILHELNRRGVPAQTWPDLAPEVREATADHRTAIDLRRRLLTLPVHQGLSLRQIEFIGATWREIVGRGPRAPEHRS